MSFEIVDKSNRDFERSYNNGQVKEAVQSYTSDARLFATDKQIHEGLNQIEKYYSNARANGNNKVELHTGQVIPCGQDHLIEIRSKENEINNLSNRFSSFSPRLHFHFSSYKLNADGGNYVVVWKKDGNNWKKFIDIFNWIRKGF